MYQVGEEITKYTWTFSLIGLLFGFIVGLFNSIITLFMPLALSPIHNARCTCETKIKGGAYVGVVIYCIAAIVVPQILLIILGLVL